MSEEALHPKLNSDSPLARWIKAHLDYPHQEACLLWPFGRKGGGYAVFWRTSVHRIMCEHIHGPAPSPKHHAAHSCGRGHDGCVNPHHVSWKTASENGHDRMRHAGGVWQRAKLTVQQVEQIIELKGRVPVYALAEEYKIAESAIRAIQAGKRWNGTSSLTRRILTEDEVRLIRATPHTVKTARQFAQELGSTKSAIQNIRQGSTYKWVKDIAMPSAQESTP